MTDHQLAVWSFWLSVAGAGLGGASIILALLAWLASNRTANKATRTLANLARGLEDLSHGHAIRFTQDEEGYIIARTVEVTPMGIPSGEQVPGPTVTLGPAPGSAGSNTNATAPAGLSLTPSIDKQVIRAPEPPEPPPASGA